MADQTHDRRAIGIAQMESAVKMFVTGMDRASVITLAGAADTILTEVLRRERNTTFTAHLIREYEYGPGEATPSVSKTTSHINDMLCINACKHFDRHDLTTTFDGDLEACALAAVAKGVMTLHALGDRPDLCEAFKLWAQLNREHPAVVSARANGAPRRSGSIMDWPPGSRAAKP